MIRYLWNSFSKNQALKACIPEESLKVWSNSIFSNFESNLECNESITTNCRENRHFLFQNYLHKLFLAISSLEKKFRPYHNLRFKSCYQI